MLLNPLMNIQFTSILKGALYTRCSITAVAYHCLMCSLKPRTLSSAGFEATRAAEIHMSVLIGKCILCGGEVGLPFLSGNLGACPPPTTASRLVLSNISTWATPPTTSKSRGEEEAITGLHLELYVWGDLKSVGGQKSAALECNF